VTELSDKTRNLLKHVSTATLTTQLFRRGFRNVFMQGVASLGTLENGNLVGPAFTLRNIPAREDIDVLDIFLDPENPQRKGVSKPCLQAMFSCRIAAETRQPRRLAPSWQPG
jgi:hypothetical protein